MPNKNIFYLLTDSDRQLLFAGGRRKTYQRDQALFHEGDAQPDLYVLLSGLVRVERLHGGHALAVARYGPGDVVGEVSFLGGRKALGTVVAEEDVEADVLDAVRVQSMLASDSGFASRFYHCLAMCLGDRLVHIRPGIPLPDAFGAAGARPRPPRTGQLSERQFPPPLIEGVEGFRNAMRALTAEIAGGRADAARVLQRVNEACDGVVDLLNAFTRDDALVEIGMDDLLTFRDAPDLARGVGGYVFRETFPFFMQSATIAQGYERPHGRAEGHDWLDRVERNEPEGDGRLGPLIDQWFLGRPLCRARRDSVRQTTALLREWTGEPAGPGPLRLTSLSAGTAREVFDLLAGGPRGLYATCIDADAGALAIDAARARERRRADRVTFLHADLPDLVAGRGPVSLGPQHVVYALGICDYLNDSEVVHLLNWVHGLLAPGGRVLMTNRDAASPDRAFAEHILDWPVVHRTPDEFGRLFAESGFAGLPVEMGREEAGVNLFAYCRKMAPASGAA